MKRLFLALISLSSICLPAVALPTALQHTQYVRCKKNFEGLDYAEQYERGKFWAQAWQTVLKQKDWTAEERAEFDPSSADSRLEMTNDAYLAFVMWGTKGKPFKVDYCLMGQFKIFDRPWSGAHSGFTDYLSPELKRLYFSLPER